MTEKIRNKWRAMAGNTRLLILITIVVTVSVITTMIVNAVLLDGDGDNMSDAYEQLFGLNPADDSDAILNYDNDALDNLAEFGVSTDPWSSDTDRDGWYDDVDNVPLSRLYIDWGNAAFTTGDDFLYTGPIWWLSAFRTGGLWQTNPPAWTVASTEADGLGSLCIEIDRGVQTNNLVMSLLLHDHAGASLGIDLLDVFGSVVAADLYGNILSGTDSDIELKLSIPLLDNTSASVISLFRTTGEITVYDTLLYVDDDGDGFDSDQEIQLGTSDQLADSDGDGLNDAEEVNIHGTSPISADSDNDSFDDDEEIAEGSDPLNANSIPVPPVDISGVITYTGVQTGAVYVGVARSFDSWELTNMTVLATAEAYTLTNVLGVTHLWLKAWCDSDADGSNDFWEAAGSYTSNPAYLTNDIVGVNITLSDPDTDDDGLPDWWEMLHFGVLSNTPMTDTDGDGLSNQAEFQLGTNPAEADSDGDGMDDGDEVALGKDPNSGNLFVTDNFKTV